MSYRDPTCRITDPEHVCRRRDGQLLTGSNGDCHDNAALESVVIDPFDHDLNVETTIHLTVTQAEKAMFLAEKIIGHVEYDQPLTDIEGRLEEYAHDTRNLLRTLILAVLDHKYPYLMSGEHRAIQNAAADRLAETTNKENHH